MGYLLDTHTFLWWISDDARLSQTARDILRRGQNDIFFSAASAWEIAIKAAVGRLRISQGLVSYLPAQLEANRFMSLQIEVRHALHVFELPQLHRDPFDRLLIAQSQLEDLPLLTIDHQIRQYLAETVW